MSPNKRMGFLLFILSLGLLATIVYGDENKYQVEQAINTENSAITESKALELALQKAGYGTVTSYSLDVEDGQLVYDIKIIKENYKFKFKVRAADGVFLEEKQSIIGDYTKEMMALYRNVISLEEAKSSALEATGGERVVEWELDADDGILVYEMTVIDGTDLYQVDIRAADGKLMSYSESDYEKDYSVSVWELTETEAKNIALKEVGEGEVVSSELRMKHGQLGYEIEILNENQRYELFIRVSDWAIVKIEQESFDIPKTNDATGLTTEGAKEIALARTGGGAVIKCKLDYEHGQRVYEVEILKDGKRIQMDIGISDSKIYSYKEEPVSPSVQQNTGRQISFEEAKEIALEKAGVGTVVKCELDHDDGVVVYEIEIIHGRFEYEMVIDAYTGEILEFEQDD